MVYLAVLLASHQLVEDGGELVDLLGTPEGRQSSLHSRAGLAGGEEVVAPAAVRRRDREAQTRHSTRQPAHRTIRHPTAVRDLHARPCNSSLHYYCATKNGSQVPTLPPDVSRLLRDDFCSGQGNICLGNSAALPFGRSWRRTPMAPARLAAWMRSKARRMTSARQQRRLLPLIWGGGGKAKG